jgi:hypothetical protein
MDIKFILEIIGASAALITLGAAANALRELRRIKRRKKARLAAMTGAQQIAIRKAS